MNRTLLVICVAAGNFILLANGLCGTGKVNAVPKPKKPASYKRLLPAPPKTGASTRFRERKTISIAEAISSISPTTSPFPLVDWAKAAEKLPFKVVDGVRRSGGESFAFLTADGNALKVSRTDFHQRARRPFDAPVLEHGQIETISSKGKKVVVFWALQPWIFEKVTEKQYRSFLRMIEKSGYIADDFGDDGARQLRRYRNKTVLIDPGAVLPIETIESSTKEDK